MLLVGNKKIMHINGKVFRTIWFENNVVKIIDQTKLPHKSCY